MQNLQVHTKVNKRGALMAVVMKTFIDFFRGKIFTSVKDVGRQKKDRADDNDEDYMNNCRYRAEIIHALHASQIGKAAGVFIGYVH